MVNAGQTLKGAAWYSRWAILAGYVTIAAVGHGVVDIGEAIVQVMDGETEVLLLR